MRTSLNVAQHRRLRVIDTDQHKIRQQLGWSEALRHRPALLLYRLKRPLTSSATINIQSESLPGSEISHLEAVEAAPTKENMEKSMIKCNIAAYLHINGGMRLNDADFGRRCP